jgi:hypothetical protein
MVLKCCTNIGCSQMPRASEMEYYCKKKERKLTHYKHVFKSGNYATINDRIDQGAQAAICLTVMVSKGPGDSLLQQCKRHGL